MNIIDSPIQIKEEEINELNKYKNKLLYSFENGWFIIIKDFTYKVEKSTKKSFWSRETSYINKYYITNATAVVWSNLTRNWVPLNATGLYTLFTYLESPTKLRNNYITGIKLPLQSLGATFESNTVNE